MTTTHASPLARLSTPIIKPTFALFAALAIGSAWADAETIAATLTGATAADDVVVTLTGETVAVDSITAASLTVNGSGTINVAGDVSASGAITVGDVILNVGGVISAGTLSMNASNIDGRNRMNAASGGMPIPIQVTAASINARISGSGVATATSGGVLLGGDTATRLVGTINAVNAVVGGTGTTTLYGTNNVSGTLTISSGSTLALGNPYLLGTIARNYDATTSAVETDGNGYITSISDLSANAKTIVPNNANVVTVLQNDENTFGGRKVFSTKTSRLVESTKFENTSTDLTTFMVWKNAAGAAAWTTPLNDSQSSGGNSYQITTASNGSNGIYKYRNGNTYNDSNYIFSNGVAGGALSASEQCLTLCGNWMLNVNGNSYMQFGSAQEGSAIAEVLIYKRDFNHAERMAIESCLMAKWGVGGVNYSPLSSTAGIVMETGSTLDVGGMSQTVKSISGTGTVRNGSLTVIDPISLSASEVLTIPASTDYTLGTVAAKVVNGDVVTLYGSVQNAINGYTAGTLTVYTTETVTIDRELTISGIVFENDATINLVSVPPCIATLEGDTLTSVFGDATFVYVGPAVYSATSGNFEIGGVATPAVPGSTDTVRFDKATSIYIGNADIQHAEFILNANVTVTGAGTNYLRVNRYTGTGKLILGGYGYLAPTAACTIVCPLEISGENANRIHIVDNSSYTTTVEGKMTGSGTLELTKWKNDGYSGTKFACDGSEFYGTINEIQPNKANASRNDTYFQDTEFSNARVNLSWAGQNTSSLRFKFSNESKKIKFGSLNGHFVSTAAGSLQGHATIEIGNLNLNDSIEGNWLNNDSSRSPYLCKVGSGTLTTSVTDTYGYILNGGTLVVMAAAAQKPVSTELAGYEVVSTVNYDTEGEDPTVVLSTAYTLRSTVRTWTGAANDNKWTTAGNWDNGVPTSSNVARFPAGTWTVFIDTDAAACAGMDVLGTVEFAQTDRSVGVHNALAIHGNVTGSGSVRLTHVGLNNASNDTITFSPNLEVLAPAANPDSDSWLSGSPFTLSGTVTVTGRICPYNINTFTGTINVPAGGSFDARADLNLDGANAVLNINGWFGEGSASDAKWLFPKNGAVINLNAGGTLSLCRISGAGYTLNFNGGTLTEYGAGYYNEKIIGGLAGTDDGIISLNVKSLGLNVDTATATTITPALQGDSESTGGGLTKRGSGALTLATAPTYTGATTVEAGALYVVEGGEWTPTLSATVEVNTDREGYRKFVPLKPSGVMFLIF
ncbi:MAG: autotransporter-associated beta strand repeat-containing protein [Kiritimatiellae bacterium]|nr:autotransporter-associated beta strand repeat-containing protein [Kiritimatiellia bacterium]